MTTDLKGRRIRVNAVSPGSIETPGLSNQTAHPLLLIPERLGLRLVTKRSAAALDRILDGV